MINLLPLEEKKKIQSEYYFAVLSVCLPILSGILLLVIISLVPTGIFSLNANQKILKESQSAEAVSKKTQEEGMVATVNDTNQKITLLQKPVSENSAWKLFNDILQSRPPRITINNFSYEIKALSTGETQKAATVISFQGIADSREDIYSFSNTLKQNENYSSVDLPVASLVNQTNFPYSISIVVKN